MGANLSSLRQWLAGSDVSWGFQIFAVVFCVLMLNFFLGLLLVRLRRRLSATENPWDDAILEALGRPLRALVWLLGIYWSVRIIQVKTEAAALFSFIEPLRDVGVIVAVAWFLIRLIRQVEENIFVARQAAGKSVDRTTADAIAKVLRASVIITAFLVVLQTLGFSISGALAFGGVGGLAVGLAAKDLLSNFFGAFFLYLDRPFNVGDWIRSPDREIEGTVEEIGWRLTRIRTFDKRPIYVPNGLFTTMTIENPSRMSNRRIKETVGIRYDDIGRMEAITADVEKMLREHPEIDTSQTLMVNFDAFASSSCNFFIYTFTKTTVWTRYHEIKQDVLLRVAAIIEGHGAEIAFPTSTVHVPDGIDLRRS